MHERMLRLFDYPLFDQSQTQNVSTTRNNVAMLCEMLHLFLTCRGLKIQPLSVKSSGHFTFQEKKASFLTALRNPNNCLVLFSCRLSPHEMTKNDCYNRNADQTVRQSRDENEKQITFLSESVSGLQKLIMKHHALTASDQSRFTRGMIAILHFARKSICLTKTENTLYHPQSHANIQ